MDPAFARLEIGVPPELPGGYPVGGEALEVQRV